VDLIRLPFAAKTVEFGLADLSGDALCNWILRKITKNVRTLEHPTLILVMWWSFSHATTRYRLCGDVA
jgi:hypothetical protein